jgi:hypothetical protein
VLVDSESARPAGRGKKRCWDVHDVVYAGIVIGCVRSYAYQKTDTNTATGRIVKKAIGKTEAINRIASVSN